MKCPTCGHADTTVAWTRDLDDRIRRARDCSNCGTRFQTAEVSVVVLKRAEDLEEGFEAMRRAVGE